MEPREYFKQVAKELEGIRTPDSLKELEYDEAIAEVVHFVWNLWERNIAPEIAAEFVIQKFGVGKDKYPN